MSGIGSFQDISKQLSVFVGLIITNCIVMGRAESFALANPPHLAFIGNPDLDSQTGTRRPIQTVDYRAQECHQYP